MTDHLAEAVAVMLAIVLVATTLIYEAYVQDLKDRIKRAEDFADQAQAMYAKTVRENIRLVRPGESA